MKHLLLALAFISVAALADGPKIYAPDGTYLGEMSSDPYAPDSISNPYGKYGSEYSPTSINNEYGTYGSEYSKQSPNYMKKTYGR